MPPKRAQNSANSQILREFDDSNNNYDEIIDLPNQDDSGDSDSGGVLHNAQGDQFDHGDTENIVSQYSYKTISKTYSDSQSKLENDHIYKWVTGEKMNNAILQNKLLLNNTRKIKICGSSPVELFELFFLDDMKVTFQKLRMKMATIFQEWT